MTRASRKFINQVFDQWQSHAAATIDRPNNEAPVSKEHAVVIGPEPPASAKPAGPNRTAHNWNPYTEPVPFRTWIMVGLRKDEPAAVITFVAILGAVLTAGVAFGCAAYAGLSALG